MAKRKYIHNPMKEKLYAWCGRPLDGGVSTSDEEDGVTCPGCKRNRKRSRDKEIAGPLPGIIRRQQRLVADRKIALAKHYESLLRPPQTWMQRIEIGDTVKIESDEFSVVSIEGRRVTLELTSGDERSTGVDIARSAEIQRYMQAHVEKGKW